MVSARVVEIKKVKGLVEDVRQDFLAIEEPLQIVIDYFENNTRLRKNLSVTMRTPGDDAHLAIGFLFTENIIQRYEQVIDVNQQDENTVIVCLTEDTVIDTKNSERNFYTTSSCGVCGKSSIDAIRTLKGELPIFGLIKINSETLFDLPGKLRSQQQVFEQTGGLHASAIFNAATDLIILKEDVGRHNALDKLIGFSLSQNLLPLNEGILLLSGRASFELIQKAAMAGITFVASVGAPSTLAVELAQERNMTLIGFLRDQRFNIYCGAERIINPVEDIARR